MQVAMPRLGAVQEEEEEMVQSPQLPGITEPEESMEVAHHGLGESA